jgi:hypothetical protein
MTACLSSFSLSTTILSSGTRWPSICADAASLFLRRRTEMMAGCSDSIPASPGAVANMLVYRNRKSAGKRVVWVSASLLSLVS